MYNPDVNQSHPVQERRRKSTRRSAGGAAAHEGTAESGSVEVKHQVPRVSPGVGAQSMDGSDGLEVAQQAVQALTPEVLRLLLAQRRDVLMDTAAAAAFLNLKPLTLCDWRVRGIGPRWVKFGGTAGAVRYLQSDLDAFILASRTGA